MVDFVVSFCGRCPFCRTFQDHGASWPICVLVEDYHECPCRSRRSDCPLEQHGGFLVRADLSDV